MSLRDHLQAIYDKHGKLTPEIVVEEARDKEHPLHERVFDKTKGEAAEAWYRHQAHELIRKARVVYAKSDDAPKDLRAFQAIRAEGPESYVYEPTETVAKDEFSFRLLMKEMEREQAVLRNRMDEFLDYVSWLTGTDEESQAA